jgi:hypothetical protein
MRLTPVMLLNDKSYNRDDAVEFADMRNHVWLSRNKRHSFVEFWITTR